MYVDVSRQRSRFRITPARVAARKRTWMKRFCEMSIVRRRRWRGDGRMVSFVVVVVVVVSLLVGWWSLLHSDVTGVLVYGSSVVALGFSLSLSVEEVVVEGKCSLRVVVSLVDFPSLTEATISSLIFSFSLPELLFPLLESSFSVVSFPFPLAFSAWRELSAGTEE